MTCFETEVFNIPARYKQEHRFTYTQMNFVWEIGSRGLLTLARKVMVDHNDATDTTLGREAAVFWKDRTGWERLSTIIYDACSSLQAMKTSANDSRHLARFYRIKVKNFITDFTEYLEG